MKPYAEFRWKWYFLVKNWLKARNTKFSYLSFPIDLLYSLYILHRMSCIKKDKEILWQF